ncbi:hypothetical protein Vi05172_g10988 [Venturia inaequalis]|nr:hypothetical protein Vi05172_g10988 [Venturia inaequalis]
MSLSFSLVWFTILNIPDPTTLAATSTSANLLTTRVVSTEISSTLTTSYFLSMSTGLSPVWIIGTETGSTLTTPLPTSTSTGLSPLWVIGTSNGTLVTLHFPTYMPTVTESSVSTTFVKPNVTETSVSTVYIIPPTSISTQVVTKTSNFTQTVTKVTTTQVVTRSVRVALETFKSRGIVTTTPPISKKQADVNAAAIQSLGRRWELPKGPFTVTVPSGGAPVTVPNYPVPNTGPDNSAPVTVCSSDCSQHCSKHISEPRQCLRFAKDIPRWGYLSSMERGPYYESYACLVCLNLPAMMETPDHPEGGNSLRETQDLVNAIYDVSVKVNIPPQLAFAIAMQESQASVRAHSGDQGNSRGTFQVQIPGAATCLGTPVDGCTTDQIYAMASLGICGQWSCAAPFQRPGIITYWQQYPTEIGWISRGYNSGSVYDQNDLTAVAFGTNSYSSDISNRMMGRVVGGFYSRTCCAKCDGRNILEVNTCGPVDGLKSDFCGDDKYSFHGQIG